MRKLKGLEDAIGMTVVDPIRDERGWRFSPSEPDPVNGWAFLSEAYFATDPGYRGRVTVPVLWDTQHQAHRQQLRRRHHADVRNRVRRARRPPELDLYPRELRAEIDELNELLYETVQQRRLSRRASRPRSAPTKRRRAASSRRSTRWKSAWPRGAISSGRSRSRPTGASS